MYIKVSKSFNVFECLYGGRLNYSCVFDQISKYFIVYLMTTFHHKKIPTKHHYNTILIIIYVVVEPDLVYDGPQLSIILL